MKHTNPNLAAAELNTTDSEELFVVDGLPGDEEIDTTNILSLLAAGPAPVESPLDLENQSAAIAELAQGGLVEVEFNATEGEIAGVVPPPSQNETSVEDGVEAAAGIEESFESQTIQHPSWLARPWVAGAVAAVVILGIGGSLTFLMKQPVAVPIGTTANLPITNQPALVMPVDMSCQPRGVAPMEQVPRITAPRIVDAVDWVAAPPVAESAVVAIGPVATEENITHNSQPPAGPETAEVSIPDPSISNGATVIGPAVSSNNPNSFNAVAAFGRGAEVFIKLRNGNLFNGKLDKLTSTEAKLRVERGEIEFMMNELDLVAPVAQAPSNRGPEAIVQLSNGNRIAGRLVDESKGKVTLAIGASEVTIPRAEISGVELRSALGLVMGVHEPAKK
ncbi:MAG: hypothetical protein ACKVS6_07700 [Planctomycetota bacterium]